MSRNPKNILAARREQAALSRQHTTTKYNGKTLRQRQQETGRTLALNGAKWRRLRAAVLRENPLCLYCAREDRLTAASQVDHADNNPANNEWSNLIACCESCHSRKTQADMGHRVKYGCDADGMPADPDHPWNSGK